VTSRQAGAAAVSVLASTQVTCMLPVKDMVRASRINFVATCSPFVPPVWPCFV